VSQKVRNYRRTSGRTYCKKTAPIYLPGTVDKLQIKGTVVMALAVDDKGEVNCAQISSGHPVIIGTIIDSIKRWKFQPYVVRGLRKGFFEGSP
jgi:hypothetical protein